MRQTNKQTNKLLKLTTMTNAESILAKCIEMKVAGELTIGEESFISQFEDWSKKELKKLTYKQFCKLRDIAEK